MLFVLCTSFGRLQYVCGNLRVICLHWPRCFSGFDVPAHWSTIDSA